MTVRKIALASLAMGAAISIATPSSAQGLCKGFGPQTPRDISSAAGANPRVFTLAPPTTRMNLCNIHTHTNAEHKGPGFSVFAGDGEHDGYKCNGTDSLTKAELLPTRGSLSGVKCCT